MATNGTATNNHILAHTLKKQHYNGFVHAWHDCGKSGPIVKEKWKYIFMTYKEKTLFGHLYYVESLLDV